MQLNSCSFDEKEIVSNGRGAGIIPISRDDDGEVRILLGRERFVNQWRGSCRWSGFEGSSKDGESLPFTALREFQEETLDLVAPIGDVRRRVEEEEYYIRIVLKVTNTKKPERYHATYVMPIDWDETIPTRFQNTRAHVEYVERLLQEWTHTRPAVLGGDGDVIGPIEETGDGSYLVRRRISASSYILKAPWTHDEDDENNMKAHIIDDRWGGLKGWSRLRERLQRATSVAHASIAVEYDSLWGLVQRVHVRRDYLEKDQVRWWTLGQLESVLDGRGQYGPERFRPYFLPVLQTLVEQLRNTPPLVPSTRPGDVEAPSEGGEAVGEGDTDTRRAETREARGSGQHGCV